MRERPLFARHLVFGAGMPGPAAGSRRSTAQPDCGVSPSRPVSSLGMAVVVVVVVDDTGCSRQCPSRHTTGHSTLRPPRRRRTPWKRNGGTCRMSPWSPLQQRRVFGAAAAAAASHDRPGATDPAIHGVHVSDCRWMSRNGATKASSYRSGVVGSTSSRCSYWEALRMNSIRSHVLHVKSRLRNSSCSNIGGRRTSTRACRQGTVDSAGRRMQRPPCNGHGRSIAEVSHGRWSASDFGGSRQINPTQFLAVSSNATLHRSTTSWTEPVIRSGSEEQRAAGAIPSSP
jgi:hypothetical protein